MKKTLFTIALILVCLPNITHAIYNQGWIYAIPNTNFLQSSTSPTVNYITATSTLRTSTFPFASTTALSATTLCLVGDSCRTSWPTVSSTFGYLFTLATNFAVNNQATTGIAWFQNGLNASTTSHFDYASTTALSATSLCLTGDVCRTTWPTGGSGTGWATSTSDTTSIYSTAPGNIGIGTTSPYSKLSVAGQIVTSNIIATSTTATSTFSSPLLTKEPIADIRAFGAKCDGVNDDTTAIQQALDTSRNVYIPRGNCISSNLTITLDQTHLYGNGISSNLVFKTGSTGFLIEANTKGLQLESISLDGGSNSTFNAVTSSSTRSGVHINEFSSGTKIINVDVHGFNNVGIGMNGSYATQRVNPPLISNTNVYFNYAGIDTGYQQNAITDVTGGEYTRIVGVNATSNRIGIRVASGNIVIGSSIFDANGYGVYFAPVFNNSHGTLTGSLINHNTVYGVYAIDTAFGFSIIGNQSFYGDWYFNNVTGFNIQGNSFKGAGTRFTLINGGVNYMKGNWFDSSPTFTRSGDNFIISDNFYTTGLGYALDYRDLVVDSSLTYSTSTTGGLSLGKTLTVTGTTTVSDFYAGLRTCNGAVTDSNGLTYNKVLGADGLCWLDRNLGAYEVATSSTDIKAYGSTYQWGRLVDGHQSTTSATVGTQSATDNPGTSSFIIGFSDWRNPKNDNLWQGTTGTNNPCPTGFRLPTNTEIATLFSAEGITNAATAFSSRLKFPLPWYRDETTGALQAPSFGFMWTSTVSGTDVYTPWFSASTKSTAQVNNRAWGMVIRCVSGTSSTISPDTIALTVITSSGNVGIGTTTPLTSLHVATTTANATSTFTLGKIGQNKGSCLELFDSAGTAIYASIAAGATAFTLSSVSCK